MIEAEQVEDRRVEIVERMDVLHRALAERVRLAVAHAGLHARASQPAGEAVGIVIAALRAFLEEGHSSKFGTPNDQRFLQHPALLEIANQRRRWLIEDRGVFVVLLLQLVVTVPI